MSRDHRTYTDILQKRTLQTSVQDPAMASREDALPTRRNMLEAIFEVVGDNAIIYNHEGHIVRMSQAVRHLLALDTQVGREALQPSEYAVQFFLRDGEGHILSEERWPVQRVLKGEILKDRRAVEACVRRLDGQEIYVLVSGAPIREQHGRIIGAVMLVQDTTERHNLELLVWKVLDAALSIGENFLASWLQAEPLQLIAMMQERVAQREHVVASSLLELPRSFLHCQKVALALVDPDARIFYPIAALGLSVGQEQRWLSKTQGVQGRYLLGDDELIIPLQAGEVLSLDPTRTLFAEQSCYELATPLLQHERLIGVLLLGYGQMKPRLTSAEFLFLEKVCRLLVCALNAEWSGCLGERWQEMHAKCEQVNKLKEQFLTTLNHDIYPALSNIHRRGELLSHEGREDADISVYSADITASARQVLDIIHTLVDQWHISVTDIYLDMGWLDLNAIIMEIAARVRSTTPHHVIRLQLAKALPILWGDRHKLFQVIMSLVDNAVKYSPQGGVIELTSCVVGGSVRVSVQDQGKGIAMSEIEKIFEVHASEHVSYTAETILCLPVIRAIILKHSGMIWAENAPECGAIFHFTLPFLNIPN